MELPISMIFIIILISSLVFFGLYQLTIYAVELNLLIILIGVIYLPYPFTPLKSILYLGCPLLLVNTVLYVFFQKRESVSTSDAKYRIQFKTERGGGVEIDDIKLGASIIGSAGSGKTESVVYNFLKHFSKHSFCGVIHDYKDFELTEMAYPLFKNPKIPFYIISFDKIINRVNPIAPRYLENEESVNEVSRVLIENLLEQKESGSVGSTKFFSDAAEGLLAGLIWKQKTSYPEYCTLPHIITIFQFLNTDSLAEYLSSNSTSKAMADTFITGKDSDKQTAGVKGTLANAFKKISTRNIFMVLSADEVPLNINNEKNPAVVSVVNNPKYETAYSPIIATIIHTITKQMSVRYSLPSFLLMEEAPTIRLLNMHRIPATLRSYNISTIYVMQDKIQNDILYGEKVSKAILSNLSYQFFGKANDPDTAKYYEQFFEIVKQETTSVSRGHSLNFDTRVTKGEREVAKIRANVFFRLKKGEFITYADGQERKVRFKVPEIEREIHEEKELFSKEDIEENYERVYEEARSIFK
ncbi:type IV secretory system conjugative DNA transfer family protein [Maribacter sp. 2308TA10-17]|uniref:type IV secretory system conjugative DNA transfer family protein n=1 Tax=Maribacter sp. 2308TA10-17 TaxID=3386276 RepID=UPI0039BD4C84